LICIGPNLNICRELIGISGTITFLSPIKGMLELSVAREIPALYDGGKTACIAFASPLVFEICLDLEFFEGNRW
jgi:hypothetical protein